jgi:hypothetical protein
MRGAVPDLFNHAERRSTTMRKLANRVIAKFRRPRTVTEFTRMLEFLLEDHFEDIACVSLFGSDKITIDWNHAVSDKMPMVIIEVRDYEAEIEARREQKGEWELS